jgi:small conductance mechanosensitive channel
MFLRDQRTSSNICVASSAGPHNSCYHIPLRASPSHDILFYMADSNLVKKAAVATSPELTDKVIFYFVDHGIQILTAIVLMGIGVFIARWVGNLIHRWLKSKAYDEPVSNLIVKVVKLLIIAFIGITALGQMGVQITPLIAGIGVAGVGVSLAMQGLLGNLVAGLTIIFSKPFTIGEYIELLGVYGQVTDIALFSTTLLHTDNSRVIVPNRKIVGEILHNYGNIRQLDLTAVIGYSADITMALSIVSNILQQNRNVLTEPAPVVGIASLNESSIALAIKPWVKIEDFVPAQAAIYQAVIESFREKKIEIPVPRRDIHLLNPLP